MPIPSKSRYPIESFDPRLRDIWLTAIRQPVELQFESSKVAIAFQNRLQQYRAALKREDPDAARMLYRAKASRSGNTILVTRQDAEFSDVLDQLTPQMLVHSEAQRDSGVPLGPTETPIPPPSEISRPTISFDELFSDITITHEGDPE